MAKFYKQPTGLITLPPGFDKLHVSWTLENVLEGFKEFYRINGKYPSYLDVDACAYLPTVKTLQRKFGGITGIRSYLGLKDIDLRTGNERSKERKMVWKRGLDAENELYLKLVSIFHEPFVHDQAKVIFGEHYWRVDFLIYYKQGKFAIDVFFPDSNKQRYTSNTAIKFRTYKDSPYKLFLCIANPEVSNEQVSANILGSVVERNANIHLTTLDNLFLELKKYSPLPYPQGD